MLNLPCINAFIAETNIIRKKKYSPFVLKARKAPSSLFDLEKIEAFEESLKYADNLEDEETKLMDEEEDLKSAIEIEITEEFHDKRLDAALSKLLKDYKLSRSMCGDLVSEGNIYVSKQNSYELITQKAFKVAKGMHIKVNLVQEEEHDTVLEENIPLSIIYEDEFMIVLNKASDMVVHPSVGNWNGTLVNAVAYYLRHDSPYDMKEDYTDVLAKSFHDTLLDEQKATIKLRPGIVHRLDKGTTGVIIIAKTAQVLGTLSQAFANRQVKKTYLTVTVGNPGQRVVIDERIGRHATNRQKMTVIPNTVVQNYDESSPLPGKRAISYVDTVAHNDKLALVHVRIQTGRTHQIRVHLQHRCTPVLGDEVYGNHQWNVKMLNEAGRPLLHAHRLELNHPVTNERMEFVAPMPSDMSRIVDKFWSTGRDEHPEFFDN